MSKKTVHIEPLTNYRCINVRSPYTFRVGRIYMTDADGMFVLDAGTSYSCKHPGFNADWEKVEDINVGDFVAHFEDGKAIYYGHVTKFDGGQVYVDTISNFKGERMTDKREAWAHRGWWTKVELTQEQFEEHFPWLVEKETTLDQSKTGFKVGDKVRIQITHDDTPRYGWGNVKNGDEGVVTKEFSSGKLYVTFPRQKTWQAHPSELVKIDDEPPVVYRSTTPHDRVKTSSDGGSTDYYKLPFHATELRHLISAKGMSKARGDIFKACYRLGEKEGVDVLYDLNKMKFFIEDLIEMSKRGEHL